MKSKLLNQAEDLHFRLAMAAVYADSERKYKLDAVRAKHWQRVQRRAR